ncbi:MAG: hypothetical protein D8B59_10935, partial [Bacteroidetes bacterium]
VLLIIILYYILFNLNLLIYKRAKIINYFFIQYRQTFVSEIINCLSKEKKNLLQEIPFFFCR